MTSDSSSIADKRFATHECLFKGDELGDDLGAKMGFFNIKADSDEMMGRPLLRW